MNRQRVTAFFAVVITCVLLMSAAGAAEPVHGPKNTTVLIIRHAEKADEGGGLTEAGEARAKAYVEYFRGFKFRSEPVRLDTIFAAADSKNSRRPRLTVQPLASALGLPVETRFRDKEYPALAVELSERYSGRNVLVCWHHGAIPELLRAMGADPSILLPGGKWPGEEYDWLIVLHYDQDGHLKDAQRVVEDLTRALSTHG